MRYFLLPVAVSAALFLAAGCGETDCEPVCDLEQCYECDDGECVSFCDEGLVCDGEGNCVSCHPACDVEACYDCVDAECVYLCDEGEECDGEGSCVALLVGQATLLEASMHGSPPLTEVYLQTMEVKVAGSGDYDIHIESQGGGGPVFWLGDHVMAMNLGNELHFHEVDLAPENGYEPDGDSIEEAVIGRGYIGGGSGGTGYIMTENVYVLELDYGEGQPTYAKIQVVQAQAGEIHVLAYWQPDGSRNLLTAE